MHVDWSSVCLQSRETLSVLNMRVSGWQGCEMPGVGLATSSPWAALSSAFHILDPVWPKPWHHRAGKTPSFPLFVSLKAAVDK